MTELWWRLPLWAQLALTVVILLPFAFSVPYAFFAQVSDPFSGLGGIGGVIGVAIAARFRNPDYWALEPRARREVDVVRHRARPNADEDINAIAVGLLRQEVKTERSQNRGIPICLLGMVVVPVVAAFRVDPRWALAALPGLVMLVWWLIIRRTDGPSARLARLEAALGH